MATVDVTVNGRHHLVQCGDGEEGRVRRLAAYIDNVRSGNRNPINNAESAMRSTLVPIMATKAIHEKRIVKWEEIAG